MWATVSMPNQNLMLSIYRGRIPRSTHSIAPLGQDSIPPLEKGGWGDLTTHKPHSNPPDLKGEISGTPAKIIKMRYFYTALLYY